MKWERPEPMLANAMLGSLVIIAQMVAAKAVRDSVFLSNFPSTALPTMTIAAATFAILVSYASARSLRYIAPARFAPAAFFVSAILQIGEWGLLRVHPRTAACLIFLHVFALNLVLTSSFWSLMNESFDPRSAKKNFGRIAGMGTVGGLLGGVLTERIAVWAPAGMELIATSTLHFIAALVLWRFAARAPEVAHPPAAEPEPHLNVREVLRRSPYLLELAALMLVASIAASLLDYAFKSQAAASIGKGPLLTRFFALFYTVTSLAGVLVQTFAAPAMLSRAGLATTVSALPLAVAAGGGGVLMFFALPALTLLRGLEVILRGSLFRQGYELFYTPVPAEEKRASKSVIDVGGERLGDAVGSGIVQTFLAFHVNGRAATVWMAMGFSVFGLVLARRLHRAYVAALEKSLAKQSSGWKKENASDESLIMPPQGVPGEAVEDKTPEMAVLKQDPILRDLLELRSGNEGRVIQTLSRMKTPDPVHCQQLIQLLAWDSVAFLVQDRLRKVAPLIVGQLTDTLLNPQEQFPIRRRVPFLLARSQSQRAMDGLTLALSDSRFQIRFRSAHALDQLREDQPALILNAERVWAVISSELKVTRKVWDSRRLVATEPDAADAEPEAGEQEVPGEASLEYLFALLGLVLPREPVATVYRALHTDDKRLRGTALEYLQTVLPGNTWKSLEALIADRAVVTPG